MMSRLFGRSIVPLTLRSRPVPVARNTSLSSTSAASGYARDDVLQRVENQQHDATSGTDGPAHLAGAISEIMTVQHESAGEYPTVLLDAAGVNIATESPVCPDAAPSAPLTATEELSATLEDLQNLLPSPTDAADRPTITPESMLQAEAAAPAALLKADAPPNTASADRGTDNSADSPPSPHQAAAAHLAETPINTNDAALDDSGRADRIAEPSANTEWPEQRHEAPNDVAGDADPDESFHDGSCYDGACNVATSLDAAAHADSWRQDGEPASTVSPSSSAEGPSVAASHAASPPEPVSPASGTCVVPPTPPYRSAAGARWARQQPRGAQRLNIAKGPWHQPIPMKPVAVRPSFLASYPPREQDGQYNINSFLGVGEVHAGKFYVPRRLYPRFLREYLAAVQEGYQLFLTEAYHSQPFRYFIELDFSWDVDPDVLLACQPALLAIIAASVQSVFQLPIRPSYLTSMRTPYRLHVNFPDVITTELLTYQCRDNILERLHTVNLAGGRVEWESVVDFPHGSLRCLGSRKTTRMSSDPPWVAEKAYRPVRLVLGGVWQSRPLTLDTLKSCSIFPTRQQLTAFEATPAYLNLIYADSSAYLAKIEERRRRREERKTASLQPPRDATQAASADGPAHSSHGPASSSRQRPGEEACAVELQLTYCLEGEQGQDGREPEGRVRVTLVVVPPPAPTPVDGEPESRQGRLSLHEGKGRDDHQSPGRQSDVGPQQQGDVRDDPHLQLQLTYCLEEGHGLDVREPEGRVRVALVVVPLPLPAAPTDGGPQSGSRQGEQPQSVGQLCDDLQSPGQQQSDAAPQQQGDAGKDLRLQLQLTYCLEEGHSCGRAEGKEEGRVRMALVIPTSQDVATVSGVIDVSSHASTQLSGDIWSDGNGTGGHADCSAPDGGRGRSSVPSSSLFSPTPPSLSSPPPGPPTLTAADLADAAASVGSPDAASAVADGAEATAAAAAAAAEQVASATMSAAPRDGTAAIVLPATSAVHEAASLYAGDTALPSDLGHDEDAQLHEDAQHWFRAMG